MIKSVLHDWDDDKAVQILRHCRDAMPSHGRVLVIEIVVYPGQPMGHPHPMIDLEMMVTLRRQRAHGARVCYPVTQRGIDPGAGHAHQRQFLLCGRSDARLKAPGERYAVLHVRRTLMPEGKFSVGNVEIVGLTDIDVDFPMPLTQLFPNVPLAAWAPHRQRYPEVFPRPDTWRPHFGGFLLRSQGRTILVDTGMGSTVTNPGRSPCSRVGRMGICWRSCTPLECVPRTSTPCS